MESIVAPISNPAGAAQVSQEIEVDVAELSGILLDWAVARCKGYPIRDLSSFVIENREGGKSWHNSWAKAGPIFDEEGITVGPWDTSPAMAHKGLASTVTSVNPRLVGKAALEAGLRCFVHHRLGPQIRIPDLLVQYHSAQLRLTSAAREATAITGLLNNLRVPASRPKG